MITIDVFMVGDIEELNGKAFEFLHYGLGGDFGQLRRRHLEWRQRFPTRSVVKKYIFRRFLVLFTC